MYHGFLSLHFEPFLRLVIHSSEFQAKFLDNVLRLFMRHCEKFEILCTGFLAKWYLRFRDPNLIVFDPRNIYRNQAYHPRDDLLPQNPVQQPCHGQNPKQERLTRALGPGSKMTLTPRMEFNNKAMRS